MLSFFIVQAVIGGAVVLSQIHLVWRGFHLAMARGDVDGGDRAAGAGGAIGSNAAGGFTPNRSGQLQPIG